MLYLIAAMAALVAGPALLSLVGEGRRVISFLDAFVMVAVPALILLDFVPPAVRTGELVPLGAVLAGFLAPLVLERITRDHRGRSDRLALRIGVVGLALHAALDGAALPAISRSADVVLGMAIVVHRVPVGLVVWWLLASRLGPRQAVGGLAALMVMTVVGFAGGGTLVGSAPLEGIDLFQAFVGGSLVHVAFHRPHEHHQH